MSSDSLARKLETLPTGGEAVAPGDGEPEDGEPADGDGIPEDEPRLVLSVQEGNRRAFGRLVDRYLEEAYAVAVGILHRSHAAEDAVQNAFLRALDRIDDLEPGSPFGPWFFRVLRSVCYNARRRESRQPDSSIPPGASGGADPEEEALRRLDRARVLNALGDLPERQRSAVLLYDIQGYSHSEIGEILGISAGTSRAHLHHGRKKLRQALGPEVLDG